MGGTDDGPPAGDMRLSSLGWLLYCGVWCGDSATEWVLLKG